MSGFKITKIYAFIATDPMDGDEGVIAFQNDDGPMMPMIGADMTRVNDLRVIADKIVEDAGIDYKIKYFELIPDVS